MYYVLYYYCLDYNGQMLVHAVRLAVLIFYHFIIMSLFSFKKISGDKWCERGYFQCHNNRRMKLSGNRLPRVNC